MKHNIVVDTTQSGIELSAITVAAQVDMLPEFPIVVRGLQQFRELRDEAHNFRVPTARASARPPSCVDTTEWDTNEDDRDATIPLSEQSARRAVAALYAYAVGNAERLRDDPRKYLMPEHPLHARAIALVNEHFPNTAHSTPVSQPPNRTARPVLAAMMITPRSC